MSFFKAYDMRGTFGFDFDLATVRKVGRALPKVVGGGRWLVGRDCRTTSKDVRDALVAGLTEAGAQVTDIGLSTTPMVYFFTAEDGYDGSVMITASHNPPTDNGLKVSMKTALPVGYANGLNEVEKLVRRSTPGDPGALPAFRKAEEGEASAEHSDPSAIRRYLEWMRARNPRLPTLDSRLRFAVDCSNGMASLLAHELFPDAVVINDTLDGTFPNHSPNPLKAESREQIAAIVRERGLDCGVIFDGDADRAMFVDERGEFVQPDYLIPIVARATAGGGRQSGTGERKDMVIHDVRTSRGAIETLKEDGFEPVMVPVGHAFAKPILRETGALCGGELAGHYYFREFHGCDSGVLAAIRVLAGFQRWREEAGGGRNSFSEMMKPIVSRYANSGELNFRVEDKDRAIERVLAVAAAELPREVARSTMDGIRIEYADGWINIRKSNTEPYLRLIAECREPAVLDAWLGLLKAAIEGGVQEGARE